MVLCGVVLRFGVIWYFSPVWCSIVWHCTGVCCSVAVFSAVVCYGTLLCCCGVVLYGVVLGCGVLSRWSLLWCVGRFSLLWCYVAGSSHTYRGQVVGHGAVHRLVHRDVHLPLGGRQQVVRLFWPGNRKVFVRSHRQMLGADVYLELRYKINTFRH